MEGKVALYDADGVKIGETFMRRARQLVKQQRAVWMDDGHSALRFLPDAAEDWEEKTDAGAIPVYSDSAEGAALVALARKRIAERRRFLLHTIAVLPGFVALMLIDEILFWNSRDAGLFIAFTSGCWLTAYALHVWLFAKSRGFGRLRLKRDERAARRLAAEVAILKEQMR